jgi:hypothetical protein
VIHSSSACPATRYELDGRGIESRCGRDYPHSSRPTLGPIQPLAQWVPGLIPSGKAAGSWRWPHTPSSAEVEERVELYLYSPSGPSWPVLWWTLHLPHRVQITSGALQTRHTMIIGFSLRENPPKREANHFRPQVENGWSFASTSHTSPWFNVKLMTAEGSQNRFLVGNCATQGQ